MSLPTTLTDFTLADARDAVAAKKISSKELTGAFVKAVAASAWKDTRFESSTVISTRAPGSIGASI